MQDRYTGICYLLCFIYTCTMTSDDECLLLGHIKCSEDTNVTQCFDPSWRCDEEWDCDLGQDESNCPPCPDHTCDYGWVYCYSTTENCDGTEDCDDGSDERNCNTGLWVIAVPIVAGLIAFIVVTTVLHRYNVKRQRQRQRRAQADNEQASSPTLVTNSSDVDMNSPSVLLEILQGQRQRRGSPDIDENSTSTHESQSAPDFSNMFVRDSQTAPDVSNMFVRDTQTAPDFSNMFVRDTQTAPDFSTVFAISEHISQSELRQPSAGLMLPLRSISECESTSSIHGITRDMHSDIPIQSRMWESDAQELTLHSPHQLPDGVYAEAGVYDQLTAGESSISYASKRDAPPSYAQYKLYLKPKTEFKNENIIMGAVGQEQGTGSPYNSHPSQQYIQGVNPTAPPIENSISASINPCDDDIPPPSYEMAINSLEMTHDGYIFDNTCDSSIS